MHELQFNVIKWFIKWFIKWVINFIHFFIPKPLFLLYINIVFLYLKINFFLANSADPDEMPHFIWVLTVWLSTHLGVSSLLRGN